jgi:hypothetical protein
MHKISWITLGLAAVCSAGLALCAGCSGHNSVPGLENQPQAPDMTAVDRQNELRLDPAPGGAPNALAIAGTITLSGLTIVDGQGHNVPANRINTGLMAQLIDEEDDILAFKAPALNGTYAISIFSPTLSVRLRVTCNVAEDLNGDGIGGDTLKQDVPVLLVQGKTVRVDLRLKRAAQADMQPVLWPATGAVVLCDLSRTDGNGSFKSYYGTFFAGGFVIITKDGDRLLEDGDDLRQPDMDHNGWPDPSQAVYGNPALSSATLSGVVISVDTVNQTLIVRSQDNVKTTVFLSPFCSIEPFSTTGEFFGAVPLSPDLTGKAVTVQGQLGPGGMIADWILYTP